MEFKNKEAAAFGTYGWSWESVAILTGILKESGFSVINEGIKALWNPDANAISDCVKFGEKFVQGIAKQRN